MKYTLFLFTLLFTLICQAQPNDSEVIRTKIIDTLEDWDGDAILKMQNGQLWKLDDSQGSFNHQSNSQEVVIYKKDCSWIVSLIGSDQAAKVIQIDKTYVNNQKNLQEQKREGYIYNVVRASWAQRLIVKKGEVFYLMSILNGECCTMGTMKFDENNYNYQNVFVKEWPNSLAIGFKMQIIEKSNDYTQLEKKITN